MKLIDDNFQFDARLPAILLEELRQCIGKKIHSMAFHRGAFDVRAANTFECFGSIRLTLIEHKKHFTHVDIESLFGTNKLPLTDFGALGIKIHYEPHKKLSERIGLTKQIDNYFISSVSGFGESPISSFKFYGNSQSGSLNKLDPDMTVEYLKENFGTNEYPEIKCESIEFVVIEQVDLVNIIIIPVAEGFKIIVQPKGFNNNFEGYYSIVNGYNKNIVLQHMIAD
ncbi:MAG: hypothetical protein ACK4Q5_15870 [Saprospiraceae bacterium]